MGVRVGMGVGGETESVFESKSQIRNLDSDLYMSGLRWLKSRVNQTRTHYRNEVMTRPWPRPYKSLNASQESKVAFGFIGPPRHIVWLSNSISRVSCYEVVVGLSGFATQGQRTCFCALVKVIPCQKTQAYSHAPFWFVAYLPNKEIK